jgi:hypothetical protein
VETDFQSQIPNFGARDARDFRFAGLISSGRGHAVQQIFGGILENHQKLKTAPGRRYLVGSFFEGRREAPPYVQGMTRRNAIFPE